MELKITDVKSIRDIQDEFNKAFPFLKLEFYSKPHEEHEGSPKDFVLPSDNKIEDVRSGIQSVVTQGRWV